MTEVTADDIAKAFGLTAPIGRLEPMPARGFVQAWRIDTGTGAEIVKHFWPHDELPWRDCLERAMKLEGDAVLAGIDTPAPVAPVRPIFGTVARIDGHGLFRAFPYIPHRPLGDNDDVAEWIGTTLARIHRLQPLDTPPRHPNWWYGQDPPLPQTQWTTWLNEGERAGTSWAPALREHLPLVLAQAEQIIATFRSAGPYVMSHLDIEPWNVLMTGDGPVLIDWDSAGPESATLEAAYVFTAFACRGRTDPDPDSIRRSYRAYVAAGGDPPSTRPGMLNRRIGRHLATITTALGGYFTGGHGEDQIRARIEGLPTKVATTRSWERILTSSITAR